MVLYIFNFHHKDLLTPCQVGIALFATVSWLHAVSSGHLTTLPFLPGAAQVLASFQPV